MDIHRVIHLVENLWITYGEPHKTCGKSLETFNSIRLLKSKLSPRVINEKFEADMADSKLFHETALDNLTEFGNWA
jgi:hypothetical protein